VTDRGTYIKMSDSLPEHRKIVTVGGDAAWLHVCALAYASRNRTDGLIPEGMVPRLSDRKQPARLAARLCDVDLWHAAGHKCKRCPQPPAGHYIVHDYLEHQRSAARIAEVSEQRSRAGRAGGSKSKPKAKQVASDLLGSGFTGAEANGQRSFAEEVLRTSQAEGSLRDPQADAEVPPTAGAVEPRQPHVGDVVAAYVDGATEAGLEAPSAKLRARVGKDARKMADEGKSLLKLIEAARRMGATEYNDLDVQYRKDDAAANGRAPVDRRQQATNQKFDAAMKRAAAKDAEEGR
jgi:hypothetical protein